MRIARPILVICTAFAALVASTLQGKVLCYADAGRHIAVEAPHRDGASPANHDRDCDSDSGHAPAHNDCTDISAKFSAAATRAADSSVQQANEVDLAIPPVLLPTAFAVPAYVPMRSRDGYGQPPPPGLACLRTIILLV